MNTLSLQTFLDDPLAPIEFRYHERGSTRWLALTIGRDHVDLFLPDNHRRRIDILEALRDAVAIGIEAAQKELVEANHAALIGAAAEASERFGDDELEQWAKDHPPAPAGAKPGQVLRLNDNRQYEVTHGGFLTQLDSRDPRYNPGPDEIVETTVLSIDDALAVQRERDQRRRQAQVEAFAAQQERHAQEHRDRAAIPERNRLEAIADSGKRPGWDREQDDPSEKEI